MGIERLRGGGCLQAGRQVAGFGIKENLHLPGVERLVDLLAVAVIGLAQQGEIRRRCRVLPLAVAGDIGVHFFIGFARSGVCLAAGLDGIEKGMTPPPEITENIFEMDAAARSDRGIDSLPGSLEEAIKAMQADQLVMDTLGTHVAENYIEGKMKEWDEYRTRVSSWEREKYIINY